MPTTRPLPLFFLTAFCLFLLLLPVGLVRAGESVGTPIGPEGGWITQFVFDPQTPGTVYAGTGGGVFKSTDNGQHWSPTGVLSNGAINADSYIYALAVDPQTPTTLYVGIGRNDHFPRSTLFKSTDGGDTWSGLSISGSVWDIAIHPTDTNIVYAGTDEGFFISSNGGADWSPSNAGLPSNLEVTGLAIDPVTPAILYAGTYAGVYKSTNGGDSWFLSFLTTGNFHQLLVNPLNPAVVYAAGMETGLIKSVNSGVSWAPVTGLYSQNILGLAIEPTVPDTLYVGVSEGVLKSTDGGENWSPLFILDPTIRALSLAVDPFSPETVYAGTYNSILRSPDGGSTWETRNTGLTAFFISDLALHPQLPGTIYAISDSGGGFLRTTDGGAPWSSDTRLNPALANLAVDPLAPDTLYVSYSGIGKSLDRGETWLEITAFPFWAGVTTLAVNPVTTSIIYAGSYRDSIYKSEDGGLSWSPRNTGLPAGLKVDALAIDPFRSDTLYSNPGGRAYKSVDGGASWQERSTGVWEWDAVFDFALDPQHPEVVYAAGPGCGCVYRSVDGGQHWSAGELTNHYIHTLAIDPSRPEILYAGTWDGGVLQSTDAGRRWLPLNAGLPPNAYVLALAVDPAEPDTVYASVKGWGIFRLHLSPDLSLAKSVDNSRPRPGQRVSYSLTVDSRVPVAGAVISDTLPAGLTLAGPVSLEPPQPGAVLAQSAADLPTLAANITINAGQVITLTLPVSVDTGLIDGTTIINVVEITGTTILTPYRSAAFITVDSPPVLALAKYPDHAGPLPGQPITYTITVQNTGGSAASGAVISDTLPAGLTMAGPVSLEPPQPGAILAQSPADLPTLAANLSLDIGQVLTLSLPVTVNTGLVSGTRIANTASVTAPPALYAPQADTITLTVTADETPPGSFFLLSPPSDTITATTRPVFDWTDAAGAASYTLVFTGAAPVTTTLSEASPPVTLADGFYTWTVLAHRAAASPAPAANGPWRFTIRTLKKTYLPLILKP